MPESYLIPAETIRIEIVIKKSRFLTTIKHAPTVAMARATVKDLRAELPGANHHVYAFRVGFGNSVTEGMSDDGEPSGTAGPPTLAVVRGSDVGDIVLVTARFFGGIKLGTGGLVRAYTESAQEALRMLRTELKVERLVVGLEMPYSLYNIVKLLIAEHKGVVEDAVFDEQILVIAKFVVSDLRKFEPVLRERTAGRVTPVTLS